MRLGKALGAPWQNVDLDNGTVWVEQVAIPETLRPSAVPLPPQAIALLRRLKATYNAGLRCRPLETFK